MEGIYERAQLSLTFNPQEPAAVPAPEQTASIISLVLWFFLDPIIFQAYRIPHLSHDQLPPIADYDQSKNLVKTGFPHLDPFSGGKKRHLFFGLMHIYRRFQPIITSAVAFLC